MPRRTRSIHTTERKRHMHHAVRDKVVLVTGASWGIGEATALALSEAGAKVAVGARRADRLADLAKRAPGEVLALEVDVTDEQTSSCAVRLWPPPSSASAGWMCW
jgi:NADP-dependent 3-hydroxy acid dehydrogenase YdfG